MLRVVDRQGPANSYRLSRKRQKYDFCPIDIPVWEAKLIIRINNQTADREWQEKTMMKQKLKALRKIKDQRQNEDRRNFGDGQTYPHNRRRRADRRLNNIMVTELPLDDIEVNTATWYMYNKTR